MKIQWTPADTIVGRYLEFMPHSEECATTGTQNSGRWTNNEDNANKGTESKLRKRTHPFYTTCDSNCDTKKEIKKEIEREPTVYTWRASYRESMMLTWDNLDSWQFCLHHNWRTTTFVYNSDSHYNLELNTWLLEWQQHCPCHIHRRHRHTFLHCLHTMAANKRTIWATLTFGIHPDHAEWLAPLVLAPYMVTSGTYFTMVEFWCPTTCKDKNTHM